MRIVVKLKSFHPYYLETFFLKSCANIAPLFNATCTQVVLPHKTERFTVLRSPHVDKKARDQFERVTYKRLIIFKFSVVTSNDLNRLFFLLKNLSLGVQSQIIFNKNYV